MDTTFTFGDGQTIKMYDRQKVQCPTCVAKGAYVPYAVMSHNGFASCTMHLETIGLEYMQYRALHQAHTLLKGIGK